jgi:hypothetical protein
MCPVGSHLRRRRGRGGGGGGVCRRRGGVGRWWGAGPLDRLVVPAGGTTRPRGGVRHRGVRGRGGGSREGPRLPGDTQVDGSVVSAALPSDHVPLVHQLVGQREDAVQAEVGDADQVRLQWVQGIAAGRSGVWRCAQRSSKPWTGGRSVHWLPGRCRPRRTPSPRASRPLNRVPSGNREPRRSISGSANQQPTPGPATTPSLTHAYTHTRARSCPARRADEDEPAQWAACMPPFPPPPGARHMSRTWPAPVSSLVRTSVLRPCVPPLTLRTTKGSFSLNQSLFLRCLHATTSTWSMPTPVPAIFSLALAGFDLRCCGPAAGCRRIVKSAIIRQPALTHTAESLALPGRGGRSPPQFVRIAHPRRSRDVRLAVQRCPGAAGRSLVGWVVHFPVGLIWARCGTVAATAARSGRQHDGPGGGGALLATCLAAKYQRAHLHSNGQALILSSTGNRRLDFSASMDGFFDEIGCASFCVCVCGDYSTSCAAIVVVVRLDCFRPTPDSVFYVNSTIAVIALVPSRSTDCSPLTLR